MPMEKQVYGLKHTFNIDYYVENNKYNIDWEWLRRHNRHSDIKQTQEYFRPDCIFLDETESIILNYNIQTMADHKLDLTSTVAEKGMESISGTIKLILGPFFKEFGLLLQDYVTNYRQQNAIRFFKKVEEKVKEYKIKAKPVLPKFLVPVLEHATLEEDDFLQDLWANLMCSFLDTRKNLNSVVYPEILRQISTLEAQILQQLHTDNSVGSLHVICSRFNTSIVTMQNLQRLNLVQQVVTDPISMYRKFGAERADGYELTDFGIMFLKSCMPPKNFNTGY